MRLLVAATIAVVAAVPASAQSRLADSVTQRIDAVFSRFTPTGPGCEMGIFQDGHIVYERGYGLANIEYGIPLAPTTPMIMGSVSKQFTAASIALLVQSGRLSLSDEIHKYVPELADYGKPITIDELVHHTSGVRDFWALVEAAGMRPDDGYSVDDILRLASRQKHLNFDPGSEYNYSNTGYVLLGIVVHRVSGKSLRQFAADEIFTPLGMSSSHFHDDHNEPVRGRAFAYSPLPNGTWRINVWNNDIVGQGGLMTTVEDLQKWDENFYTGRVGGRAFLARQLERGRLSDGKQIAYAFGLEIGAYRGLPIVEHSGSTGGYRTDITRFPTVHTSVVTMCNVSNADAVTLAHRVADIVLALRFAEPVPAATRAAQAAQQASASVTLSDAALSAFAGRFYAPELDATYTLNAVAHRLVLARPRAPVDTLRATDEHTFRGTGFTITFSSANAFTVDNGRARGLEFTRAQ